MAGPKRQSNPRPRKRTQPTPTEGESRRAQSVPIAPEAGWYKDAIIYEVHVRAFADSDADGIGDFAGLTSRLDYLQDLGVTAIWLLPFYPSPLRDDGYDIADYTGVNPSYGTRRDVRKLIDEAHKRGLKIITELVLNHTSDQHAWFKRARKAPPGSPHRNFYVWNDTPEPYREARIIFQDFETSNWTYDPVARQYFWHRFYSHQPDLNFDNPDVHAALMKVVDQWFDVGVDGMRLDAVPYLYEREGTNCENLPETHDFLKKLRAHVDERYPGRMLLAEANQWPEDSIEYFGDGDSCHMAFHFPLMPRLFMAVRMEDRFPVIDILQQTPPVPEPCQWAIFLRNHDELTLEMVTDEERDYMYRSYASDREMRINLGIRRRLAPLLDNNRRKIELMNGLLFSLPGTPVLYYGDEIGMGDNVYLGDRDSVRTPMQWSGDRNAGFSHGNPQRLYLPVIIDPQYHYETVNVESQQANPSSLFWWMKRLIAHRKRHRVFGRGDIAFLNPENPRVLAYVRRLGDEHVLVVANLSRFAQPVEMDLSEYQGQTPIEMFGHTAFPPIGELPYFFTLGPHTFHWFLLKKPVAQESGRCPVLEAAPGNPKDWLTSIAARRWLEPRLPDDLKSQRWFSSKTRAIRTLEIQDIIPMRPRVEDPEMHAAMALVHIDYGEADSEVFVMPLVLSTTDRLARVGETPPLVLAHLLFEDHAWILYEGSSDAAVWSMLLDLIEGRRVIKSGCGEMTGTRFRRERAGIVSANGREIHPSRVEQSNSSAIFGDRYIMKLFRHLEEGPNPDLEVGLHLTENVRFPYTPTVAGAIEYRRRGGETATLAMLQRFVPNEGDSWRLALDAIGRYFERVLTLAHEQIELPKPREADPLSLASMETDRLAMTLCDEMLDRARLLGQRTAEMHHALATEHAHEDDAFSPEPFNKLYQRSLYQSMRNAVLRPMRVLHKNIHRLDEPLRTKGQELLDRREELVERLKLVAEARMDCIRIRCHGDYHLGQVLWTGRDFVIIDFEGEPMRPLGERRVKRSALQDVAGMIRSFQYAAVTGLHTLAEQGTISLDGPEFPTFAGWAKYWRQWMEGAFLGAYLEHADSRLIPHDQHHLRILLDAWLIQKASYELAYELNNRPDWVRIPIEGLIELLDGPNRA